jgi:DNA-binding CsgD family transcriptional regulator
MFPDWLKKKFTPYGHAYSIENFGNQIKARYLYLTKDYQLLLTYIEEMKRRESILFGRVEMLAMQACVHYQMKNKRAAFNSLQEAYEEAEPNNIIMPFMELGKDMRILCIAALHEPKAIPRQWLESIKNKATAYAKAQSMLISKYVQNKGIGTDLSDRERDILSSLYRGLTRPEIAKKLNLSVNTVNMIMKIIYEKLNVHKVSDAIRVAAERKLI